MARKLKKARMSMSLLVLELLTPWVVMGGVAAGASIAGMPDYAAIIVALAAALIVTFLIRNYEQKRRRTRSR